MLKLMKYEFRKALAGMLVLLGITAALNTWFFVSLAREREGQLIASVMLLVVCTYASAIFVFIRGITSYSSELKNRSSYLLFMTPNSALKIVGSKFIYTFVNALLFVCLFGALAFADLSLMFVKYADWKTFLSGISSLLTLYGVPVHEILLTIGLFAALVFSALISVIAVSYLAVTVSHTLFRDKKWRWLPTLILFGLMMWGLQAIYGLLPFSPDTLLITESVTAESTMTTINTHALMAQTLLPMLGINVGVILISLFGCAAMLERKVSL